MSLSSCEKCWDDPCTCGHEYKSWPLDKIEAQIRMLTGIADEKRNATSQIPIVQAKHPFHHLLPPERLDWKDINDTRTLIIDSIMNLPKYKHLKDSIMNLPKYKHLKEQATMGLPVFPLWIGSPPNEEVNKVKNEVIKLLAYRKWENHGKPLGRDKYFWELGENQFNNAFMYWM
jgi:hypothetical protein